MKIKKSLLIISIVLISLFVIGAVSANDNATDIATASDDNEVQSIDNDLAENTDELQAEETTEVLSDSEPEVNVTADAVAYDENITIEVSVGDKNDPSANFSNKNVSLFIDDAFIKNLTLNENGKASHIILAGTYGVGSYHVFALMNNTPAHTVLNITKATPVINVENVEAITGTVIKIPFNVTDKNGKGIDGDVLVTIHWSNDDITKYVHVTNGKADVSFDISDLLGIFSGNGTGFNFTASFGNGTNRTSFNITALFGENGTFNITTLFGKNGTNSTFNITNLGGNSTFNITTLTNGNGTFNFGNLTNGTGSFNFANMFNFNKSVKFAYVLDVGTYNMTVTYLKNRNYETASNTANLTITYAEDVVYNIDVTTPDKYGDSTIATIALIDKYGKPISNKNITICLNGIDVCNMTLNENGTAVYTFENLTNGDYNLTVYYGNESNSTFEFLVAVPMTTTIICKDISVPTVNVGLDGKIGKYLTITLKDNSESFLTNETVKIGLDGKEYTLTTDENGVAKLQLNIAKAGTYTASIGFLGDDLYSGSFKVVKVTVKKQSVKLTPAKKTYKAKAKTKKLTATLKTKKKKALKNKKVTFKVNGKTYTGKTNSKGVATVKVKLTKKGKYNVAVKFAGDNTYNAISKKVKLILK